MKLVGLEEQVRVSLVLNALSVPVHALAPGIPSVWCCAEDVEHDKYTDQWEQVTCRECLDYRGVEKWTVGPASRWGGR